MKTLVHLLLFALLPLPAFGAGELTDLDTELKKTWPDSRTINIVFHGHSVPSGYHLTPEVKPFESYPFLFFQLLKQRYPSAVINVITTSIGGENSGPGSTRFAADVLPHQPDLIYIDYALNDRPLPLAQVDTNWKAMIAEAKTAGVPVVLVTPTGASDADLSNPADPLTERADLIRALALSEDVLLADVSAAWQDELASGTPQGQLLSQGNHPNLEGHTIAADAIFTSFSTATIPGTLLLATEFPRDSSTNSFTTTDTLVTFTTTNTFSGQGSFLGDSGGPTTSLQNAWDGGETLSIALAANTQLSDLKLQWTVADITITGFDSNPGALIGTANGNTGTATWTEATKTLVLDIPWGDSDERTIRFTNPVASGGNTLNLSFSDTSGTWQAAFTSFTYLNSPG